MRKNKVSYISSSEYFQQTINHFGFLFFLEDLENIVKKGYYFVPAENPFLLDLLDDRSNYNIRFVLPQ